MLHTRTEDKKGLHDEAEEEKRNNDISDYI